MSYDYYTLDVFTDTRFGGNPLAVVLGADDIDSDTMQIVAREFNLSETVFVMKPKDSKNTARVRIFTPGRELPFAGHPTVGTAILLAQLWNTDGDVVLEEVVGPISVTLKNLEKSAPFSEFSGAVMPFEEECLLDENIIAQAIGLSPDEIGFGKHESCLFNAGNRFLFVPVKSRVVLKKANANAAVWPKLLKEEGVGIYVYCAGAQNNVDYHARLFALNSGIIEDPATGSAAAAFPGALHKAEQFGEGAHQWAVAQGEDMGRPSLIALSSDISDGLISGVRVGGHAVRVTEGKIEL